MSSTRKKYTAEFKESAVKLVTERGYTITEAARNLGINPNMLSKWKSSMEPVKTVEGSIITRKEQDQEIARLKKENERLRQEREILKKAVVFFTQEPGKGIK
jgi:transposase